jgi:hypothetical protein
MAQPSEIEPDDSKLPARLRPVRVWLGNDHIIRLEQEALRRVARGDDKNTEGERINVNRSTIVRGLIEEHLQEAQ